MIGTFGHKVNQLGEQLLHIQAFPLEAGSKVLFFQFAHKIF